MSLEFPPPINDFFKQIKKGGPAFEFESNSRLESSEHDLGLKNSGGDPAGRLIKFSEERCQRNIVGGKKYYGKLLP